MKVSSLSDYESVCLVATYNDLSNGEKRKVSPELKARGYTDEQLAHARKDKADKFNSFESCGLRFTKPTEHLKFDLINYVLTLFEIYEKGSLPFPGSASEQPAQIMEIFFLLNQLKSESQIKLSKEISKQSNGRNKHKN